jgi:malate dehydrogenase
MKKVTVIGAGNVGAMTASRIVDAGLADVILLDVVPGLAKGKALDISDSRPITGSSADIKGSEDFQEMRGSGIIVVTAGLARKPGMSREDLLKKNSEIITGISDKIKKYCPASIVITVTNPLDAMTYLVMKRTGFEPQRVIGMAGVLDSARFMNTVSEKIKGVKQDEIFMMGSHGDTMVAINRSERLSDDVFNGASDIARHRGAEIVACLKTGSAYFSPSAAVFYMVKSIANDEKKTMCASAYLNGQYGQKDIYIGVPVILGALGVIKVIEQNLTEGEIKAFNKSAQEIKETISKL